MPEPTVFLSGLGIPESPRWHQGRLWFCNWIDRQVMAADLDGGTEVVLTRDPASHPMGYSIDWLPDGRLLTTGDQIRRREPDGWAGPSGGAQPAATGARSSAASEGCSGARRSHSEAGSTSGRVGSEMTASSVARRRRNANANQVGIHGRLRQ